MPVCQRVFVTGIVQGVGFRPFVYGLAVRLGLRGWVSNTSSGVEIVVQGEQAALDAFTTALRSEKPPLARIDSLEAAACESDELFTAFDIRRSTHIAGAFQPISADVAICPDCERELFDPQDRRYLYPFINCTNCGPRFTIIQDIPYDRPATTMSGFEMCPACRREYEDPLDRRFHAQPIACPECGPFVQLRDAQIDLRLNAILKARRLLRQGRIVAVKGLGGYHLACDAANSEAVRTLRQRKGRAAKPFAVMAASLSTVRQWCRLSPAEEALLAGREKPIVLLNTQGRQPPDSLLELAPGLDTLGVMLPYTPLHHLLLDQSDPALQAEPVPPMLVMTSGNFSEEPIATDNTDALERLAPLADAFLVHNREIHIRCDDSVVQLDDGLPDVVFLRRSRGYAPYPVYLPFETRPTLATGGELKNTFCLTRGRYAFLSHHIGDMENAETYASFEQGVEHLARLFRVSPEVVVCDMHPGYFTTTWAHAGRFGVRPLQVQHHHAHIAACLADNGLANQAVIGLAFDGTGYGSDGAIWGGEVLLADYAGFERAAHLEYLPLAGGDSAIRHPWRIAVGYALALGLEIDDLPFLRPLDPQAVKVVRRQVERSLNAPRTSSLGRLFDAAAALLGLRADATYEAQAAIELEVAAAAWQLDAAAPLPEIQAGPPGIMPVRPLLEAVIDGIRRGQETGLIAARFHQSVAGMALEQCRQLRQRTGIAAVALSGGVWQNRILLGLVRAGLMQAGFTVYFHRQTPTNDGGIALGQAVIAHHQLER